MPVLWLFKWRGDRPEKIISPRGEYYEEKADGTWTARHRRVFTSVPSHRGKTPDGATDAEVVGIFQHDPPRKLEEESPRITDRSSRSGCVPRKASRTPDRTAWGRNQGLHHKTPAEGLTPRMRMGGVQFKAKRR